MRDLRGYGLLAALLTVSSLASLGCDRAQHPPADEPHPYQKLGREEAKELLYGSLPDRAVRIVFLGDSITAGWAREGADVWAHSFAPMGALNLGLSGDRTQTVLYRLRDERLSRLQPALVVLMIGTNNASDGFHTPIDIAKGTHAIVTQLGFLWPNASVLVLGALPRDPQPSAARARLLVSNQILEARYFEAQTTYLDVGFAFLQPSGAVHPALMPDALHLNRAGYRVLEEHLKPLVLALLDDSL